MKLEAHATVAGLTCTATVYDLPATFEDPADSGVEDHVIEDADGNEVDYEDLSVEMQGRVDEALLEAARDDG